MSKAIRIDITSNYPIYMSAEPDDFGKLFAGFDCEEQVAVLRAIVTHMRPHALQWDHIGLELEKTENSDILHELRCTFFPEVAL